jgi:hypothetical protein
MATLFQPQSHDAIVARRPVSQASECYLRVAPGGAVTWDDDPAMATAFDSMREATRAALQLPGAFRAFGLPRHGELTLARQAA